MTLIKPKLKDAAFLDDVKKAELDHTSFHLWWLGQSGFLIQWQGKHLLLDPYLSDSLTEKYADTDKPHVRMTAQVTDPARLTNNTATHTKQHTTIILIFIIHPFLSE